LCRARDRAQGGRRHAGANAETRLLLLLEQAPGQTLIRCHGTRLLFLLLLPLLLLLLIMFLPLPLQ